MEGERRRLGALVVDPGISPRLAADSEGVHLFGTILCLVASEDKVAALVAYFLCVHNSFSSSNCYLAQFQRGANIQCTFLSFQLIGGLEPVKLLTSWKGLLHVPFILLIHSSSGM
ncbi:hypothetical protein ABZP36_012527 [Zizania latifolia]